MKTLIKLLSNESSIIKSVIVQTAYPTIKLVDSMIKYELESNPTLTYEQKCKLEIKFNEYVTFNLIKSVSNYLVDSDSIEVTKTNVNSTGIEVVSNVTRDGQVYSFITEMIHAGGYNIQKLHVRYIIKTELKKIGTGTKLAEQRVSKIERLKTELGYYRSAYTRYESDMIDCQICNDTENEKVLLKEMKKIEININKYITKIKEELSK